MRAYQAHPSDLGMHMLNAPLVNIFFRLEKQALQKEGLLGQKKKKCFLSGDSGGAYL